MQHTTWLAGCGDLAALCLLTSVAFGQSRPPDERPTAPHWIWHRDTCDKLILESDGKDDCTLEQTFRVEQHVKSARMRLAADFCDARVEINGQRVARVEPYSPTIDVDVAAAIRSGENRIIVVAAAAGGPAAIALSLSFDSSAGLRGDVVTDDKWRASRGGNDSGPAVSMGTVDPGLSGLGRRPATIDAFDNYEQWRQALGTPANKGDKGAFWTVPGFEISLIRQSLPEEGSWVSMAFDPQGRLTVAREDKGLLRMALDGERTAAQRVETINGDLQECRGLLYAYNALYANANNSKGLYRLRDTDGDDTFDEVRLLREFPGGAGHGRNDLALGPDGLIYSIHGDAVDVPQSNVLDATSPFREARRGRTTREGYVLRTDRDGQRWELLAAGLRNPFGITFHANGDLFTYDADAEFDMGSPWYRPTRVVQLASGSDFGWRGVTGKWPPYFPDHADNALPTLDIGKGSPTAVAFGTGTSFPTAYQNALFILDWAYGRILAVHLAPRGASYRGCAETFLQGRPLNVTDLAVGPDGALWIVTGGRKTQSALYRIKYTGDPTPAQPPSSHEAACQKAAQLLHPLRVELESRHQTTGKVAVVFAWPHLDSSDPVIRNAARIAVEHQPLETWRDRALAERRPTTSLSALLALARSGDKPTAPVVIEHLLRFPVEELTTEQVLLLLQAYFLCLEHAPDDCLARRNEIVAQVDKAFPYPAAQWRDVTPAGTSADVNRNLARLLANMGSPSIVEKVVRSLLASDVQEDRLLGLFVLCDVRTGWNLPTRRAYYSALNEASSFVGGEGMPKFLAQIREHATATISDAERGALAEVLAPRVTNDDPLPLARPLVKQWTLEDLAGVLGDDAMTQGNAARGAAVFRDALCTRCHRSGARGPAVGPDLTHVAGRFGRRDILESILIPSKVVAENYRNVQIITTDGRQIVGRIVAEGDFRSEKLRIATDPLRSSAVVELSKREIEQFREVETSPMPHGLLDSFSLEDIHDLLAFLQSGREANTPGR
jgi:putative heme-binding domain-containing protein